MRCLSPPTVTRARASIARIVSVLLVALTIVPLAADRASAAPSLTITPITWNVVGLDSNDVSTGPNEFLSGAKVCNTGSSAATNVVVTYVWDSGNANIDLQPGSGSARSTASLAAGSCYRAYFNIEIARTAVAYNSTRSFHISATADTLGTVSTPTPREIYVEKLVSQNRNGVISIVGPTTVYVGNTYTYTVTSKTATGGYEQLSSFLDWPGAIFEVRSVSASYSVPAGATNTTVYADACGWENDPGSANYRSCVGPVNFAGGKAGGNPITTTYTVNVVAPGTTTLGETIYDFSGSSYHYNSDFGTGVGAYTITALAQSDVAVTKTDAPDPVIAGQNVTYTLHVTNNGPSTSASTTLSDPLPNGTSFVSATGGGTLSGGTVTWNLGTLASGASTSVDLILAVDASRATDLTNTATVATDSTDPTPANNSATEATTVNTSAHLSIVKTDSPDPVGVGEQLTYTLAVANDGPSDARNVHVSDPLPSGLTFDSVTSSQGSCSQAAGAVTCDLGTLAADGNANVTIKVTPTLANVGSISNTATVSSTTSDPGPANNTSTEGSTVQPRADVSITKTDLQDPVNAGSTVTYLLTVSNDGPSQAQNVHVTDPLPAGTTFVSATGGGTESGGTVTWDLGDIADGGASSVQLVLSVDLGTTSPLSNTASVSTTTTDPTAANNTATETTGVQTSTDVGVAISDAPDPVSAGTDLTYTIDVTNAGPSDASGVLVSNPVPAGTTFVSASGGGTESGGTATWDLGTILAGGSASLTLVVHVDPTQTTDLSDTASVSTTTPDTNAANDTATELTGVLTSADLAITKTDLADPVTAGIDLTYEISVTNQGPSDAAGVQTSDPLPVGTSFVSATDGGTESGGIVSWDFGSLANGAAVTVQVVVHVDPAQIADLSNTASVSSSTSDPTSANDSATETTGVLTSADLSTNKTDSSPTIAAGASATYTVTVTNAGPSSVPAGVVVTDPIPAGTTGSTTEADCSISASVLTCTSSTVLAPGDSVSWDVSLHVSSSYAGASLSNTATIVSSPVGDPDASNDTDTDTDTDTVVPAADLSITKTDLADPITAGTDLTYSITVTNDGPGDATGVQISDPLPVGTSFVSATGGGTESAGTVSWDLGSLPNGATATVQVVVHVNPGRTTDLSNTASVSSSTFDPTPANDSATEITGVQTSADLAISKTDLADPVTAGTDLTYEVSVTNQGPSDATGVQISDPLPAGTSFVSATGGGTESGGTVTWDLGSLANGVTVTVQVVVSVDPSANSTLSNTASVSTTTTDPTAANNTATETTGVQTSTDVGVAISDAPDPVSAGTDLTYTIDVTNAGPSDASGVLVSDPLPAGTSFVSASGGGTESGGIVSWDLGTIPAGGSVSLTLVVHVDPAQTTDLSDTASVSTTTPDTNAANDTATELTGVQTSADLAITKTDSSPTIAAGVSATYTITITNAGPSTVPAGVVGTDAVPAGTTASTTEPDCSISAGVLSCTSSAVIVPGGSIGWNVTLDVSPAYAGPTLSNTATIVSSPVSDPDASNDTATDTDALTQAADLSITKTDLVDPITAGTDLTYSIAVTDNGPADATGVQISDPLPAGTSFVSATNGGTESGGTVIWDLGPLANGATVTVQVVVHVDPARIADLSNTASGSSTTFDPSPANDTATETTGVQTSADLSIAKSTTATTVDAGASVAYTIVVSNAGPSDAQQVVVTDALPVDTSFVSASGGGTESTGTVTWNLASVPAGTSVTLQLTLQVAASFAGATLTNTANVNSTTPDPDLSDLSSSASVDVRAAANPSIDLGVAKTVDDPTPAPGESLTYTVTVSNGGPATATQVVLSDRLPAGLTYVDSHASQGSYHPTTHLWQVGTIAVGGAAHLRMRVTVDDSASGTIVNTASVRDAGQRDTDPRNDVSLRGVVLRPDRRGPGNDPDTRPGSTAQTGANIARALAILIFLFALGFAALLAGRRRREPNAAA